MDNQKSNTNTVENVETFKSIKEAIDKAYELYNYSRSSKTLKKYYAIKNEKEAIKETKILHQFMKENLKEVGSGTIGYFDYDYVEYKYSSDVFRFNYFKNGKIGLVILQQY